MRGSSRWVAGFAVGILGLGLAACRTAWPPRVDTSVTPGATLHGRLAEGRGNQAFTFEGVEASILDFEVVSDDASLAAPRVDLRDPNGQVVDIAPHQRTSAGSATMRWEGIVLLRSGIYQVAVRPEVDGHTVFYRFRYDLRFPPIEDMEAMLTASRARALHVSAPRGGMVTVWIVPKAGSDVRPEIRGVEDPWGGRALDASRRPRGTPAPRIAHTDDGGLILNFAAPIPGRYTVLAAAQPGREGAAVIETRVVEPRGPSRVVLHPDRPPQDFGVPAPPPSGSASDG